jgi:hypothetical protein
MTPGVQEVSRPVRVAAEVLWRGLAVVAGLQLYWALGGTWAVHAASGGEYSDATTGLRVQSAVVAVLLVAAILVVRARIGLWRRPPVSDRVIRAATWVLAAALALAAVVNFAAATSWERFGIGPIALVLALLALVVAGSGGERRRIHRPHRTLPSH